MIYNTNFVYNTSIYIVNHYYSTQRNVSCRALILHIIYQKQHRRSVLILFSTVTNSPIIPVDRCVADYLFRWFIIIWYPANNRLVLLEYASYDKSFLRNACCSYHICVCVFYLCKPLKRDPSLKSTNIIKNSKVYIVSVRVYRTNLDHLHEVWDGMG